MVIDICINKMANSNRGKVGQGICSSPERKGTTRLSRVELLWRSIVSDCAGFFTASLSLTFMLLYFLPRPKLSTSLKINTAIPPGHT